MRLRRAEMMAISLPEKKPFPSSSSTIETAINRGSDMVEKHRFYRNAERASPGPPPRRVLVNGWKP